MFINFDHNTYFSTLLSFTSHLLLFTYFKLTSIRVCCRFIFFLFTWGFVNNISLPKKARAKNTIACGRILWGLRTIDKRAVVAHWSIVKYHGFCSWHWIIKLLTQLPPHPELTSSDLLWKQMKDWIGKPDMGKERFTLPATENLLSLSPLERDLKELFPKTSSDST